jgi:hypothetical protein
MTTIAEMQAKYPEGFYITASGEVCIPIPMPRELIDSVPAGVTDGDKHIVLLRHADHPQYPVYDLQTYIESQIGRPMTHDECESLDKSLR